MSCFAKKILILLIHKGNIPYLEPAAIENILDKNIYIPIFKITFCFTKTIRVHSGIRKFRINQKAENVKHTNPICQ